MKKINLFLILFIVFFISTTSALFAVDDSNILIDKTDQSNTENVVLTEPTSVYDFCENIPGVQEVLPNGLRRAEGSFFCTEIPKNPTPPVKPVYDFCTNIKGIQATLPNGLRRAEGSFFCTEIRKDQILNSAPKVEYDFCENMDGVQATLPDGYKRAEGSFECVEIIPTPEPEPITEYDFCENIPGVQEVLPNGLRREEGSFFCTEIPKYINTAPILAESEEDQIIEEGQNILETKEPEQTQEEIITKPTSYSGGSSFAVQYDFCSNLDGIQDKLPDGFKRAEGSFECKLINEGETRLNGPTEDSVLNNFNTTPVVPISTVIDSFKFTKDLFIGVYDLEVLELQKFLNNNGYLLANDGPGSIGNETDFFGLRTKEALIKFQKANNIKPAVGYFGPITRDLVNTF